jgi:hypothetical protein
VFKLAQSVQNLEGIGIDIAARELVLGARNDPGFDHRSALYQRRN